MSGRRCFNCQQTGHIAAQCAGVTVQRRGKRGGRRQVGARIARGVRNLQAPQQLFAHPQPNVQLPPGAIPPAPPLPPPAAPQQHPALTKPLPKVELKEEEEFTHSTDVLQTELKAYLSTKITGHVRDPAALRSLMSLGDAWLRKANVVNPIERDNICQRVIPVVMSLTQTEVNLLQLAKDDDWWSNHKTANLLARGKVEENRLNWQGIAVGVGMATAGVVATCCASGVRNKAIAFGATMTGVVGYLAWKKPLLRPSRSLGE